MNTSYFGNIRNIKNPLSISLYSPKWYKGNNFECLAPTPAILSAYKNKEIDNQLYNIWYMRDVLDKLDPKVVYNKLISCYNNDVTLLCYELPNHFCHRRIVADWLSEANNVEIPELITTLNGFL